MIKVGILFNLRAFWIGAHYSSYNKRLCFNIIPCVTVWTVFKGGKAPQKEYR